MPDYQKGKIYSIRSHETDEIYIGSTTQTLSQRFAKHRCDMKKRKDGKCKYTTSFKILEYPTCYIELLENYSCNSREELEKKEGEYIRSMECVNRCVAGRTQKEYRQDNIDIVRERERQYARDNSNHIKEYKKQYRLDNADKIKEQTKQYRLDNADKIKEHANQKHNCECGGSYTHKNIRRHEKTKKHQAYITTSTA